MRYLEPKYGRMLYAFLERSRVTMVRSRGNTFSVFTRELIAQFTATTYGQDRPSLRSVASQSLAHKLSVHSAPMHVICTDCWSHG